jgi:predicted DNA-binding ribbon-helix-helix protein
MLGCNENMKKQTGVLIDSQVWDTYRELCRREKVRPSELIGELLRRALESAILNASFVSNH